MEEVIKFTEEELKKIKGLQDSYQKKMIEFGDVKFARIALQQQWDALNQREQELESEYVTLQQDEKTISDELNTKYGNGTLNLESGEFTKQ